MKSPLNKYLNMAGTIIYFSILHQEHPISHKLIIYAEELWKEEEGGEALGSHGQAP